MSVRIKPKLSVKPGVIERTGRYEAELSLGLFGSGMVEITYSIGEGRPIRFVQNGKTMRTITERRNASGGGDTIRQTVTFCRHIMDGTNDPPEDGPQEIEFRITVSVTPDDDPTYGRTLSYSPCIFQVDPSDPICS